MNKIYRKLQKEARQTILQYAIFRWENAVILAGTILLTAFYPHPFPWWPIWAWPLLGLLGMGGMTFASLNSVETNARILLESFQEKFDVRAIQLESLREEVRDALQFQRRIEAYLAHQDDSLYWDRAQDTAHQIRDWIEQIYRLAVHLDTYLRDAVLREEIKTLPVDIENWEAQRAREKDPALQRELDRLLESKRQHLQTLDSLDRKMKQADLQLEHSLSALATIDSQIRLIGAQDVDSKRSDWLKADIQEHINRLGDLLASINEVYDPE
jgi:hypothetical protein